MTIRKYMFCWLGIWALSLGAEALGSAPSIGAETPSAKETQCVPKSLTARLLQSPNPNDIDPHWRGQGYIGLSWSFIRKNTIKTETGIYFVGKLVSPRGGVQQPVFILSDEWNCGPPR
jgi:hypothetical protein